MVTMVHLLKEVIIIEWALERLLSKGDYVTVDELQNMFTKTLNDKNIDTEDKKSVEELKNLEDYYQMTVNNCKYDNLVNYQEKIEVQYADLPIPIVGYIDFVFKDFILDLKTTGKMPSKCPESVRRQMAVYSMVYTEYDMVVDYVTPKKYQTFKLEELQLYRRQVYDICMGLMRFLSTSDSPLQLTQSFHPNFDHWAWDDTMKNEAKKYGDLYERYYWQRIRFKNIWDRLYDIPINELHVEDREISMKGKNVTLYYYQWASCWTELMKHFSRC